METPTKQPDSQVKELRNGRLAMLAFSGAKIGPSVASNMAGKPP